MTKLEIIEQLFDNGYCLNPSTRALDEDENCQYYLEDGRQCAVGKCMKDPKKFEDTITSVGCLENLETELKPEYQGHSIEFWDKLQGMHDCQYNWGEAGLTERGVTRLNELKQMYSE